MSTEVATLEAMDALDDMLIDELVQAHHQDRSREYLRLLYRIGIMERAEQLRLLRMTPEEREQEAKAKADHLAAEVRKKMDVERERLGQMPDPFSPPEGSP